MSSQDKKIKLKASKSHDWVTPSFDDFEDFTVASQPTSSHSKKTISSQKSQASSLGSWCDNASSAASSSTRRKRIRDEDINRQSSSSLDRRKTKIENVPWAEKHTPQCQADLAVHKKKIAEVEEWLRNHIQRRKPSKQTQAPVLLLTGPTGAGKTATVQTLAKEMRIEVQEWVNPVTSVYNPDDRGTSWRDFIPVGGHMSESQQSIFQDFLTRSNKYQTLQIFGEDTSLKKLVLVEDFPNTFYRSPQFFHTILKKFSITGRSPLVFIVSDSHGGESNALKLFPKDVQASLGVHNISFNPVAPTSMAKVMLRIANKEALQGKHKCYVPSKSTIEALASASCGDIRSAINSLQFACLKDTRDLSALLDMKQSSSSSHGKATKSGKQTSSRRGKKEKSEDDSDRALSAIGGKDTSLFLFRALGKILYCKRNPKSDDDPVLPDHLSHHDRDPLKINPEHVLTNTHMSSENFNLYLHQNYLEFYEPLDDVVEASRYFSDADFLASDWTHRTALREYGASVAARSLIHFNSGRSRHNATSTGKWRPLHKPEWFEVFRKYRESCAGAKGLFVGHCWTPVDLQTQLLPYLAIINIPLKNPGQIAYLQELTRYSSKQLMARGSWPQKLDEKEVDTTIDDDDIPSSQKSATNESALKKPEIVAEGTDPYDGADTEDEDENIVIEDFDD
ncbi:cell cycle checkpoint protein RAD17-like [Amphiura filiformis]|uniref:cell cycle checkpoint protein RAD17-like n=1 Tax=Amphiura filiformis TaxID=82378 RepID=UPI003B225DA4